MKGKIMMIRKVFDEIECKHIHEILIETENKPDLKLGEAEITQNE